MKLDLFKIDDFIEANHCPEVTNPIFFNFDTTPKSDGLFSYELFGISDEDRKNIFGYIDLKGHYIHPIIWLMMEKKMGSMGRLIHGEKYAVIADKKVKYVSEDFKGAETGLDFLYDHWEEIDWINEIDDAEIDSIDKKSRLKFLKSLKKDEVFITKWLVIPPFYRAESSTNRSMGDNINKLYKELISRVNAMKLGFSFDIFAAESKLRIQALLKDIYYCCLAPVSGKNLIIEKGKTEGELRGVSKNSMLRKHLLGKNVDWSASNVITSPLNSTASLPGEKPVPYGYSAFPLATLLSLFQPFYINWCGDFLMDLLYRFNNIFAADIKSIDLGQFSAEKIQTLIKRFIKAPNNRFDPITFEYTSKDGKKVVKKFYVYKAYNANDIKDVTKCENVPLTITDLFYIASREILSDKHVYVTRFPIANFQNIYPCRIKVLSTSKTRETYLSFNADDTEYRTQVYHYDNYPLVPKPGENPGVHNAFYDVMLCGNAYLDTLGGDYDGDMLYMRAVFTQEANQEAERLIWAKTNMLNAKGEMARGLSKIGKECIMGLYELTKSVD